MCFSLPVLESSCSSFKFHFGIIVPSAQLAMLATALCPFLHNGTYHTVCNLLTYPSMRYLNISSVKPRAVLVTSVFLSPSTHMPPRAVITMWSLVTSDLISDHPSFIRFRLNDPSAPHQACQGCPLRRNYCFSARNGIPGCPRVYSLSGLQSNITSTSFPNYLV